MLDNTNLQQQEDAILETPEVLRVEVGRQQVDDETIYRFVNVFGNDELGYIASSEEWFSPNRAGQPIPEFFEVRFQTSIYPTAAEALADALPSALKEAAKTGEWQMAYLAARATEGDPRKLVDLLPAQPAIELNPADYEITDGYVGSFGKTYQTATADTLSLAIAGAVERSGKPVEEIKRMLADGEATEWCDSPNYYYDHSKGIIRRKRKASAVALVACDCGHRVPRSQVMSASRGTSCPDCYDRMSN